MKLLVVYGLHKEEALFGREIWGTYNHKYRPLAEDVQGYEIQNPAARKDRLAEQKAYAELQEVVRWGKPSVLLQLDSSGGRPRELPQKIREDIDRLRSVSPSIAGPILKAATECLERMMRIPLQVFYTNENKSRALEVFLEQQSDLFNLMFSDKQSVSLFRQVNPAVKTAESYRVQYLHSFAHMGEAKGRVIGDDHENEGFKRTIELVRRLHEYIKSHPMS